MHGLSLWLVVCLFKHFQFTGLKVLDYWQMAKACAIDDRRTKQVSNK